MLTVQNANVSLNSFREQSVGRRIVFFYPWSSHRTFFLTHFLSKAREGLLYYRVPDNVSTLQALLSGMMEEFSRVLGQTGANVRATLGEHEPERLGEALAAELNALPIRPAILYIDEFNRIPVTGALLRFMDALQNTLKDDVQIALNARLLSDAGMNGLVEQGHAVVLGNHQHRRDLLFTLEAKPKAQLEVRAFGRGSAMLNGNEIVSWDGMLPRHLFFYLIDHSLVTRDDIFADFWGNVPLKDATDIFHVTKHKVTEVIGRRADVPGDYEITQYKQGFYLPSDNLVRHYDVEDFESALERAFTASDPREIEILLRHALDLYQGHYLQDSDGAWVLRRREHLMRMHCEACIWMARILEQRGDAQAALDLYTVALHECPQREDVHRAVIRLHLQLGRVDRARDQYQILHRDLYQQLGIKPSQESLELLREIEAGRSKSSQ